VLLIPGFLAGDQSLSVMATWLRRLGYRPRRAGIAFNVRCSDTAVDRLERTLHHAHLSSGRKVAIVGHSRGGHFAKALASRNPDEVSQVISMGRARRAVRHLRADAAGGRGRAPHGRPPRPRARAAGLLHPHLRVPLQPGLPQPFPEQVPLTSIYSKGDGVVRWRACVVPYARCVEVTGSHIGLAFNRHAYREIATTLAPT
jgi:pimeloyl-ACP methyl ester carboxylesterase